MRKQSVKITVFTPKETANVEGSSLKLHINGLAKANEKTVSKDNSVHPQRNCKCRGVITKTPNKLKKKCSNPLTSTVSTKEILHN